MSLLLLLLLYPSKNEGGKISEIKEIERSLEWTIVRVVIRGKTIVQ